MFQCYRTYAVSVFRLRQSGTFLFSSFSMFALGSAEVEISIRFVMLRQLAPGSERSLLREREILHCGCGSLRMITHYPFPPPCTSRVVPLDHLEVFRYPFDTPVLP